MGFHSESGVVLFAASPPLKGVANWRAGNGLLQLAAAPNRGRRTGEQAGISNLRRSPQVSSPGGGELEFQFAGGVQKNKGVASWNSRNSKSEIRGGNGGMKAKNSGGDPRTTLRPKDCLRSSRFAGRCSTCGQDVGGVAHVPIRGFAGMYCAGCCPCCQQAGASPGG